MSYDFGISAEIYNNDCVGVRWMITAIHAHCEEEQTFLSIVKLRRIMRLRNIGIQDVQCQCPPQDSFGASPIKHVVYLDLR